MKQAQQSPINKRSRRCERSAAIPRNPPKRNPEKLNVDGERVEP